MSEPEFDYCEEINDESDLTSDFVQLGDETGDTTGDFCQFTKDSIDEVDTFLSLQNRIVRSKIPKPLEASNLITITGTIDVDCERFAINLMCGDNTESDIGLHVNPRFSERYLVQNHRLYGKWGPEATTGVGLFNLQRGKPFIISILVSEYQYMIAMNGNHYATFPFKINIKKVGYVEVNGGVVVDKIEYTNAKHYPSLAIADNLPPNLNFNEVYQHSGITPLVLKLVKPFLAGQDLIINGALKLLPMTFTMNLQNSCHVWPHPIIPLHINARFAQKAAEIYLVRNSWNGQWSAEERSISRQFVPGRPIELTIRCDSESYTIWTGSKMVASFFMRLDPNMVTHILIEGDFVVKSIQQTESVQRLFTNDKFVHEDVLKDYPADVSAVDVSSY